MWGLLIPNWHWKLFIDVFVKFQSRNISFQTVIFEIWYGTKVSIAKQAVRGRGMGSCSTVLVFSSFDLIFGSTVLVFYPFKSLLPRKIISSTIKFVLWLEHPPDDRGIPTRRPRNPKFLDDRSYWI